MIKVPPSDWNGLIDPINHLEVTQRVLEKNILTLTHKMVELETDIRKLQHGSKTKVPSPRPSK